MKKETVYWCVKQSGSKQLKVIEKEGYLYDVFCPHGTVRVGLVYVRPWWRATHYESGLDCTPYSDSGGYNKHWRNREELLDAIKDIDFHARIHQAKPFIDAVNKYKEEHHK